MKVALLAVVCALVVLWNTPATTLACGYDLITIRDAARQADRIVLGTVADRVGSGVYTYTISVERVIKGGLLDADRWIIVDAGASDCGMPILNAAERVVLEYYNPGRITDGPWFYAWNLKPDGTLALSDSHRPPLPTTLEELLARYAAALGPPDTATEPGGRPGEARPETLILAAALIGGIAGWRRASRRPT